MNRNVNGRSSDDQTRAPSVAGVPTSSHDSDASLSASSSAMSQRSRSDSLDVRALRRALVVDNNVVDQILLRETLFEIAGGLEVEVTGTLNEALEELTHSRFDVVLLDLNLPDAREFSGLRAITRCTPGTPVVAVTRIAGESSRREALSHGADDIINKDALSAVCLESALSNALRRKSGYRHSKPKVVIRAQSFEDVIEPSALIDPSGRVHLLNRAWRESHRFSGGAFEKVAVGANYLSLCYAVVGESPTKANELAAGIRSVLVGDVASIRHDYRDESYELPIWRSVKVVAADGKALLSIGNALDEKRGEESPTSALQSAASTIDELSENEDSDATSIFALLDARGNVIERSSSTLKTLGVTRPEDASYDGFARLVPDDVTKARQLLGRLMRDPMSSERIDLRIVDDEQRVRILDLTATNRLNDPDIRAITVIGHDVTRRRFARIASKLESTLLHRLPAAVLVYDDNGTIVYWNESAEEIFGFKKEDAVGRRLFDLRIRPSSGIGIEESLAAKGTWEGTYDARRADGALVPIRVKIEKIYIEEIDFHGTLSASIEIRELRELEERLAFQARHDSQSGLPNRRLFLEHLEAAMIRSRDHTQPLAVLLMNVEENSAVLRRTGHVFRDETMKAWIESLAPSLRQHDFLAHLGGSEFALCMEYLDSMNEANDFAERLVKQTGTSLFVGLEVVPYAINIGVTLAGSAMSAEEILHNADVAMFSASQRGISGYETYDISMHDELVRRNQLRDELISAIDHDQIDAYFQPVVSLVSRQILGFEALARWHHHERGMISPEAFIPLAEESGFIGAIFTTMLRATCQALRTWQTIEGGEQISVALNLSPSQLDEEIVDTVRTILREEQVDASHIALEITESSVANETSALQVLHDLKALGLRLALDDFGTGYSSLHRLHEYPFDYLKIDKSMVDSLRDSREDSVIMKAILSIATALQLKTVAEGIEVDDQLAMLQAMGCDAGQGFLWSRAVPLDEATSLLLRNREPR